jgi:hypothetical protein
MVRDRLIVDREKAWVEQETEDTEDKAEHGRLH